MKLHRQLKQKFKDQSLSSTTLANMLTSPRYKQVEPKHFAEAFRHPNFDGSLVMKRMVKDTGSFAKFIPYMHKDPAVEFLLTFSQDEDLKWFSRAHSTWSFWKSDKEFALKLDPSTPQRKSALEWMLELHRKDSNFLFMFNYEHILSRHNMYEFLRNTISNHRPRNTYSSYTLRSLVMGCISRSTKTSAEYRAFFRGELRYLEKATPASIDPEHLSTRCKDVLDWSRDNIMYGSLSIKPNYTLEQLSQIKSKLLGKL